LTLSAKVVLELSYRTQHANQEFALTGCGIHACLVGGAEAYALCLQAFDDDVKIVRGTRDPIEPSNEQDIALSHKLQALAQSVAIVRLGATDLLTKQLLRATVPQPCFLNA
jgi:hypothetical protein